MTSLPLSNLTAVSAVDGRYGNKTADLRPLFSEYGLFYHRVHVELTWLKVLLDADIFPQLKTPSSALTALLDALPKNFDLVCAEEIKSIEATTNHDVKAIEYFLARQFENSENNAELKPLIPLLHFACTSEDINNLAWAMILKHTRDDQLHNTYRQILDKLITMAETFATIPMLARTHGQAASPTTVGKEMANVAYRLHTQIGVLESVKITGKFNGAVGNFNAHHAAYDNVDWQGLSQKLVETLGLDYSPYTTQIEPHDHIAELMHAVIRNNVILIDLCRDIWGYISLGYFGQRVAEDEVGSSTMPHKVNPIDFENAEGNFGIANSLAKHNADKLPVSRWQRDLSDSTVLRSLGTVFAHTLIALDSLSKGLDKITVVEKNIADDLNAHWEVLAEAIQVVLRKHGNADAYERLKTLTRGKDNIDKQAIQDFIRSLDLPQADKDSLLALTPSSYIGLAKQLAENIRQHLQK